MTIQQVKLTPMLSSYKYKEAVELLESAQKWLRLIHERRDEVSGWLRHGADPAPLITSIQEHLDSRHD